MSNKGRKKISVFWSEKYYKLFKRRKSKLKITPGESVRNVIIQTGIKAAEESAYLAENQTDQIIKFGTAVGQVTDLATSLGFGIESGAGLGKIAFKASKDIARRDPVFTGCCETVALSCATMKFIPFRGRIYVGAKSVSKGCMTFRNACAGEGC